MSIRVAGVFKSSQPSVSAAAFIIVEASLVVQKAGESGPNVESQYLLPVSLPSSCNFKTSSVLLLQMALQRA